MAATHDQVTAAFQRAPELQNLLLRDAKETGRVLGTGSYGTVMELRVGATLCAGKKIHEALIDPGNSGAERMMSNFLEECKLMSELRHPRIAQFMGVCLLPSSTIPILVTELLSDCLQNVLETRTNLPLVLKRSILTDVASALVYLHSRTPPLIHRDLTAQNVLIEDTSMKAKITDMGNSRFVDPTVARHKKTMTRIPGTLEYMPPEALEEHAKYSDKLDTFSFGHLALYTITQVFPQHLLAPNSCDPDTDELTSRTEVQRRTEYMSLLYDVLGKEHALVKLIQQCLHNSPRRRPTALEALDWLNDSNTIDNPDQEYELYALNRGEMMDYVSRKEQEIEDLRRQIDNRDYYEIVSSGDAGSSNKSGPLEKLSIRVLSKNKKWSSYTFKIMNETHLKYFKSGAKKPRGEISLSTVTNVVIVPYRGERSCFEVHFSGKDSPWALAAYSTSERKSWMEAIRRKQRPKMQGSKMQGPKMQGSKMQGPKMQGQGLKIPGTKMQDPKIKANFAYGFLPLDPDVASEIAQSTQSATEEHMYDVVPLQSHSNHTTRHKPKNTEPPVLPTRPLLLSKSSTGRSPADGDTDDAIYDECLVPSEQQKCPILPPKPSGSNEMHNAESNDGASNTYYYNLPPYGGQTKPAPNVNPHQRRQFPATSTEDPEYKETVSILDRTAAFFSPAQIEHLITMLQHTHGGITQDDETEGLHVGVSGPGKVSEMPPHLRSTSPLPPKAHYVNYLDIAESPIRGSKSPQRQSSHKDSSIYAEIPGILEVAKNPRAKSKKPLPPPKPPTQHPSAKPPTQHPSAKPPTQHTSAKPSTQHTSAKPSTQPKSESCSDSQKTLRRILKQSSVTNDPVSLLVTEDRPEDYILRPAWAKANASHPHRSTLAALHHKSLYISPSSLHNMTEQGEGQFGKVYRAQMRIKQQSITVAVKSVPKITADFRKEVTIMAEMVHPNIVSLYGLINEGNLAPAMVMEYLPNGDLKSFLSHNKRNNDQLMKYMIDVAMGMHYLTEKGIIHRDLAARNVLVDGNEMCKVADFGLVREVPREAAVYVSTYRGSSPLRWMAPESITNREFCPASDVWSYGVLQWEMFNPTKLYPYPNMENNEMMVRVAGGYRMPDPQNCPPLVVRIMKSCWNSEPAKRPSFLLISKLLTGQMIAVE